MEQFEKWDKQEYPLPPTTERGPIGRDALKQRKHTWRAALEWVKREAISLDERGDISRGIINRELKGGD